MEDHQNRINSLSAKLDRLLILHETLTKDLLGIHSELEDLKAENTSVVEPEIASPSPPIIPSHPMDIPEVEQDAVVEFTEREELEKSAPAVNEPINQPPKGPRNLEKFIGENLLNKIGIAITILGVAIGTKYSIEHDLVSPLTRIILGYLVGVGTLLIGIRLKAKYEAFSAVLVSGSMAMMYFVTYSAYAFYELIPQLLCFGLMVLFIVFVIIAAINYNRRVIAYIGLLGAYAIPFLLSTGSGQVELLFTYVAIINAGIMVLAFKKYWKGLFITAFVITWIMYISWFLFSYHDYEIGMAFTFLGIFFATFYATFLGYKLLRKEPLKVMDLILLMLNSTIFYGVGYELLDQHDSGNQLLGLFTLLNAVIHFAVSVVIYKQQLAQKDLLHILIGLVLVFVTMSIPVQLEGNWVTLLWISEAFVLFWIGRVKRVAIFEYLSYPLFFLAACSLIEDWSHISLFWSSEVSDVRFTPIFNTQFLTTSISILFLGIATRVHMKTHAESLLGANKDLMTFIQYGFGTLLLCGLYFAFQFEITGYWNQRIGDSIINIAIDNTDQFSIRRNPGLMWFKNIWTVNYSLLFATILSFVSIKWLRSPSLTAVCIAINSLFVLLFLSQGLYGLSELREYYLEQTLGEYYSHSSFNIALRYISLAFVGLSIFTTYRLQRTQNYPKAVKHGLELAFHTSLLWIISSELLHWMDMFGHAQSYKLALSLLWGMYALMLIALGIWKGKKFLRIGAIVLFSVTLCKLFFYDLRALNTISKTIVFVSLGILLLIISFLYNKFKHKISDETDQ